MGLPRGTVGKDQDMWHYGHQRGFNEGERVGTPGGEVCPDFRTNASL